MAGSLAPLCFSKSICKTGRVALCKVLGSLVTLTVNPDSENTAGVQAISPFSHFPELPHF